METTDSIQGRRSIRKFADRTVTDEQITACLEAARVAPSATNSQPWKLLVVRSDDKRAKLQEAAFGQKHVGTAPVVFVLLGDTKAYRKRLRRGKELMDVGAIDKGTVAVLAKAYASRKKEPEPHLMIMLNCMLAGQNLVLEAQNQGLGTCWVMLMDDAKLSAALELPSHLFPVALIPAGYADQSPAPRPRYSLEEIAADETLDHPWKSN